MRLATWNINGLSARLPFVLRWLSERSPDVVGLQELKLVDERFPHEEFAALGYRTVTHGQPAWNGVAIASRLPLGAPERGLPGQEDFGSRLVTTSVSGISFTTVYVPNGKDVAHEDFPRKLAWLDSLASHLSGSDPTRPAILCGDFNVCPGPLDSWNEQAFRGSIHHTDEERA